MSRPLMVSCALRFLFAVAAGLALSSCATSDPGKQTLAAGDQNAAIVLMKVIPGRLSYHLTLSAFDPVERALQSGSFNGFTTFEVDPTQPYVAKTITPGTHVFALFAQQLWWSACFQAGTWKFDVKPGEVVYLGEFNPEPSFDAIAKHATANGDFSASSGNRHFYFDDIPPPAVSLPQDKEKGVADVQGFVKTRMPNVFGTVRLAEYQPTKFGVGTSLFGDPVCGGYFKKPPKD